MPLHDRGRPGRLDSQYRERPAEASLDARDEGMCILSPDPQTARSHETLLRRFSTLCLASTYTQFAGLPYLAHLYRRGICICTGSGIGAVLSTCVQLDNWFLIWIGSDMEKTFGPVLFDMIRRRIPKERYILFDTKKEGCRPDTMKMLKDI